MYLYERDFEALIQHLDSDEELAWIVPAGSGRWIARKTLLWSADRPRSRHVLWHIPSGPIPLADPGGVAADWVHDPWNGWRERHTGADPDVPWLGDPPGVYHLNLRFASNDEQGKTEIGMSSFEWIGNYWRVLGRRAEPSTQRHWRRLTYWARSHSQRIPREGPLDGPRAEIYAFPEALTAIRDGARRALNPF
jgi:hypothetical protein